MIINNPTALKDIVKFIKKYFSNVKVVKNKYSHLADRSQNFWTTILFENRGTKFSIEWNYAYCTLYFGDITKEEKTCFQYAFTKIKIDTCCPIEDSNNNNVVFWEREIIEPFDDMPFPVSPLRMPINKK